MRSETKHGDYWTAVSMERSVMRTETTGTTKELVTEETTGTTKEPVTEETLGPTNIVRRLLDRRRNL